MSYGLTAVINLNSDFRNALLLLNKKPGITSFEALNPVKKALGSGKAGHTGTLDKFAGGLLVVLTGKALKLSSYFTNCGKRYEARVFFGSETDTLDPEGNVTAQAPVPEKEAVEAVLSCFCGEITQIPPAFSAIHVNGKRASQLARSGVPVEMKPRKVTIYEISLRRYEAPFAYLDVRCSAGTYIRALARDIAIAAGSRAHLACLTRTQSGAFLLGDALAVTPETAKEDILNALRPIDGSVFEALDIPVRQVDEGSAAAMRQGKPVNDIIPDTENFAPRRAAVFCGGDFIALVENMLFEAGKSRQADRNCRRRFSDWRYGFVF
ncbi:MAG: tRNA pseudouridine(55) synthase TruB [Spirochaetaceae bacterium]|jgi:tRNA pseudouridine55 synthase|nr:tRNA pseudouridine(55) synthase TruB [Spirochaetaceae bacterium]